jgi:hypothetical protein
LRPETFNAVDGVITNGGNDTTAALPGSSCCAFSGASSSLPTVTTMLRVVRTSNDVDDGRFCSRIAKQEREVDLAAPLSLLNWGPPSKPP